MFWLEKALSQTDLRSRTKGCMKYNKSQISIFVCDCKEFVDGCKIALKLHDEQV